VVAVSFCCLESFCLSSETYHQDIYPLASPPRSSEHVLDSHSQQAQRVYMRQIRPSPRGVRFARLLISHLSFFLLQAFLPRPMPATRTYPRPSMVPPLFEPYRQDLASSSRVSADIVANGEVQALPHPIELLSTNCFPSSTIPVSNRRCGLRGSVWTCLGV
jgi:hypothetical protein